MANIGKLWAGAVYGTNTGNLFIEFDESGSNIVGILRFMDTLYGLSIFSIQGTFDEETLRIIGNPTKGAEDVTSLTVEAKLTPEGHLRGTWKTVLGTGGTSVAYPHDIPPHFHIRYNDYRAVMNFQTLNVIDGHLPAKVRGLIEE